VSLGPGQPPFTMASESPVREIAGDNVMAVSAATYRFVAGLIFERYLVESCHPRADRRTASRRAAASVGLRCCGGAS